MASPERKGGLALRAGRLIDGTGGAPIEGVMILVEWGRIREIVPDDGRRPPADAKVIDLRQATVMPGLIDCHLHLIGDRVMPTHEWGDLPREAALDKAAAHAGQALRGGVTTVRDCGAHQGVVLELRRQVEGGVVLGPHVWACDGVITIPRGHGHFMGVGVRGAQAAAEAAEAFLAGGADFIKVIASGGGGTPGTYPWDSAFTPEELRAIVDTAHRRGARVCAHAHAVAAMWDCVEAGIDTIEHATFITADGPRFDQELAARLAGSDTYVIPTMACYRNPVQAGLPKPFMRKIGLAGQEFIKLHRRYAAQLIQHGVKVAAGTDGVQVGVGPADVADEAKYLAETAGSNMFGLQAATRWAADALGLAADRGTIEPGKRADLLALAGNPLEDMDALRRVALVVKNGEAVV